MKSLASRLSKSTMDTSRDLVDAAITRDERTTHAVGVLLDHLDIMTIILKEEMATLHDGEAVLDENTRVAAIDSIQSEESSPCTFTGDQEAEPLRPGRPRD